MRENEVGAGATIEMGAKAEGVTALLLLKKGTSVVFLLIAPFTEPMKKA